MKLLLDHSATYTTADIFAAAEAAQPYVDQLTQVAAAGGYASDEASINVVFDESLLHSVESLVTKKVSPALRYIFVVGIGGSNLGTKAIYDALYGYQDLLPAERPQIVFVDTNNEASLDWLIARLLPTIKDPAEYLLVTISKSGGTTETLANTELLLEAFTTQLGDPRERTVVITDEGSTFWQAAVEAGVDRLAIPHQIGGRYSVFSAVGLFPLAALGLDIRALLQGAKDIHSFCLQPAIAHNPAWQSAAVLTYALADGKTIHDTFVFNSELESLGKWYRQLLGESIGKQHDRAGHEVFTGITPTVSVGSTDLHSVGQLYLGGPKDKITTFVYTTDHPHQRSIPSERVFPSTVPIINGKTTTDIMAAILGGTKIAYNQAKLPFMEVQLAGITPYELGAFMQFKMMEMMILGHLLQVNPFDQPNVESYKIETKKLLEL